MGYGSHALDLLGKYYEGHVASLSEGQLHVDPITSIDPDQVSIALYLVHYDDCRAFKLIPCNSRCFRSLYVTRFIHLI